MTAAGVGKPMVGVGMHMEQAANPACLMRKGVAIRVAKSKPPVRCKRLSDFS